ncbi:MAG TPA: FAD-dependent oxidoreductase, partial [Firmicutes bacterium]|nr:FAD-dependent oxidoreductase [Bacillota bacterium]
QLVGGVEMLFRSHGVTLVRGEARMSAPGVVEVKLPDGGTEVLSARHVIVATGSQPENPPIPSEQLALCLGSDDALEPDHVPESMLIIGGGVLGVEFACLYRAFGCKVDMVKRSPLILPPVDEELSRRMMAILRRQGITVHTGIYIQGVEEKDGGRRLTARTKEGQDVSFEAEVVLVAMGRTPDFGGLDLDTLGVKYDRKGIKVGAHMATDVPGIWAIGDVVGRTYLASVASAEGLVAVDSILGEPREMDYLSAPYCVFSLPEIAGVGLTEKAAREAGRQVKVARFPFSANGRAQALGETEGLVKVVAEEGSGKILGLHVLGSGADLLVHEGAVAIKMGATARDVAEIAHAHPTLAETVMEAAEGAAGQSIHLAKVR